MRFFSFAVVVIITCLPGFVRAQVVGDFRSVSTGLWTDASTWERFDGITWAGAASAPSSSAQAIVISVSHTVSIPASQAVVADQIVVNGNLTVDGTLSIENGTGVDLAITGANSRLLVNGTLIRQNLSEINNSVGASAIEFSDGSVYDHRYTMSTGDMPAATWAPNSTLLFSGFRNTGRISANSTWDQEYGNVTFNNTGQKSVLELDGHIRIIRGTLALLNNSSYPVRMSVTDPFELFVGGDVIISGSSRLVFGATNTVNITIGGDFRFSSVNTAGSYGTASGSTTIDLTGDFIVNAGVGRFRFTGEGTTGNTTLNLLNGNFQLISGNLEERGSGAAQGNIRFLRAGQQTFRNTGTISGYFNYYVSPATTLDLGSYGIVGSSPSAFVLDGGTLVLGSTHTAGAISLTTTSGNIRTPVAGRAFNAGSTLIYRSTSAQYIGAGHPTVSNITTIIDNPAGVNLIQNCAINHALVLESGTLHIQNYILTLNSTISTTGGTLGGNQNSRLTISGIRDGSVGTLPFSPAANVLGTLDINRSGTNVDVTVGQPLTVHTQVNLVRGTLINNSALTLRNGLVLSRFDAAEFTGNRAVTLEGEVYHVTYRTLTPAGGPYAVMNTGSELPDNDLRLGNLVVNLAQTADRVQLGHYTTVNGVVNLERGYLSPGNFGITMNGPNWNDNTGNLIPGGGVVIFNGATSIKGTSDPLFGNIQVNSAASADFVRDFTIQGNVSFLPGSNIQMNNVTATFSGANPQNVSANGASFSNIRVAKTSGQGILLLSQLNLNGLLQFVNPSSNVNFQSNGHLHLISTSDAAGSGTARIYRLLNDNRISGDVVVNRFMSGEGRIYRYISSPITNSSVAQLKDDIFVGGDFIDPSPTQVICGMEAKSKNPSIWYYDESAPGGMDDGWVVYPAAGSSAAGSTLAVGRGYAVFIRNCDTPTIIDHVGPINQGALTLPVTYTSYDPGGEGDGWNVVGNPYPSAIDWDAGWAKTRISPVIAVTDDAAKMFRYYEAGVTDEVPNGQIAMGQAFHVRATGANPLLRITENAKVGTVPEFFREAPDRIPNFMIALSRDAVRDYAYVKVVSNARRTLDEFDAPKIRNESFGLSTISDDNVGMAINAVEALACGMSLPLRTDRLTPGSYSFSVDTRGDFSEFQFVLTDRYTDTQTILSQAEFNFVVTTDSLSAAPDRFSLLIDENIGFAPVTVANASACAETVVIGVHDAQPKVKYAVFTTAGVRVSSELFAANQQISFPSASLPDDNTSLILKAVSACGSQIAVSEPFNVSRGRPILASLTNQFDCATGDIRLVAAIDDPTATVNWYAQESDSKPLFTGAVYEPGELKKNKTYFAEVITAAGCSSGRQAITTDISPAEPPTLTQQGQHLIANYDEGTVWYFNEEVIAENTKSVKMEKAGQYSVAVTVRGCVTLVNHYQAEVKGLQYYPNPVQDILTLEGITPDVEKIQLLNGLGVNVLTIYEKGRNFDGRVNLKEFPDGVYLLVVAGQKEKRSYRIIKETK